MAEPRRWRRWLPAEQLPLRSRVIGLIIATLIAVAAVLIGVRGGDGRQALVLGAVLAVVIGGFFALTLYHGVRLDAGVVRWNWFRRRVDAETVNEVQSHVPAPDLPEIGEGVIGLILTAVLWIVTLIVATGLLWIGLEIAVLLVLAVAGALYWTFRRATRLALRHRTAVVVAPAAPS